MTAARSPAGPNAVRRAVGLAHVRQAAPSQRDTPPPVYTRSYDPLKFSWYSMTPWCATQMSPVAESTSMSAMPLLPNRCCAGSKVRSSTVQSPVAGSTIPIPLPSDFPLPVPTHTRPRWSSATDWTS